MNADVPFGVAARDGQRHRRPDARLEDVAHVVLRTYGLALDGEDAVTQDEATCPRDLDADQSGARRGTVGDHLGEGDAPDPQLVVRLLRFLQVLCIAPVFPLIVARIALRASGAAIGFINSARIGAAFVGPVLATTMLGWSSPAALYVMLALVGIACAPLARMRGRTPAPWLV